MELHCMKAMAISVSNLVEGKTLRKR